MKFRNLLAQSAMAGWSDGAFCRRMGMLGMGMVTLGGYNIDEATCGAAVRVGERRREFLVPPGHLAEHIAREARFAREGGAKVCVNLRFSDPGSVGPLCGELERAVDLVELNLHCRQPEFLAAGSGEALLAAPRRIRRALAAASDFLPALVKVRAVSMPPRLPSRLPSWGAFALHLDLMKPGEPTADIALLRKIRTTSGMPILGNNSVRTEADFVAMLEAGANMASMARGLLADPGSAGRILESPGAIRAMARGFDASSGLYLLGTP